MGYYTHHKLSIVQGDATYDEIQDYINESEDLEYALGNSFGKEEEPRKWYDHENDMRKMSKDFPNTLFLLEGEGEESGDIWKEYYLNGKMQRCYVELVFEEFDESKLE